ncbi:MAG: TM2 domain-containing protein [Deltaproteobacteria bacterium]|nr:TM2 domain-containing protein [Deltaproteobacteria bacterium]
MANGETHNLGMGYLLWIFGFMGAHRFYYGRPVSGTIWFLTLGLLGIGWLIDLVLMPSLDRSADFRYESGGPVDYNVTWILLTFVGMFGIHRIFMGKYLTGLIYFLTGGLFFVGVLYDYWTLNEQLNEVNAQQT